MATWATNTLLTSLPAGPVWMVSSTPPNILEAICLISSAFLPHSHTALFRSPDLTLTAS